jgi:hypothetical protein
LRAVRNAATHLLDARLDDALAKPEPPPRKRARPPPEPRRRAVPRYEPETPEQASLVAAWNSNFAAACLRLLDGVTG